MALDGYISNFRIFEMDSDGTDRALYPTGDTKEFLYWQGLAQSTNPYWLLDGVKWAVKFTGISRIEAIALFTQKDSGTDNWVADVSIQADSSGEPSGSAISGLDGQIDSDDVEDSTTLASCTGITPTDLTRTSSYWLVVEYNYRTSGHLTLEGVANDGEDIANDYSTDCILGYKTGSGSWGSLLTDYDLPTFCFFATGLMGVTYEGEIGSQQASFYKSPWGSDSDLIPPIPVKNDESTLYRAIYQIKVVEGSWKRTSDAQNDGYFYAPGGSYCFNANSLGFYRGSTAPDGKYLWSNDWSGQGSYQGYDFFVTAPTTANQTVFWGGITDTVATSVTLTRAGFWANTDSGYSPTYAIHNIDDGTLSLNWEDVGTTNTTAEGEMCSYEMWFKVTDNWAADELIDIAMYNLGGGGGQTLYPVHVALQVEAGATEYTKTASLDALIKASGLTKTTALDSLILAEQTKSTDLDAILVFIQLKTAELDALLTLATTKSTDLDSLLLKAQEVSTALDAYLKYIVTKDTDLDALLTKAQVKTSDLDAILKAIFTKDTDIDALLTKALSKDAEIDAILLAEQERTTELDAFLLKALSKTAEIDALIKAVDLIKTTDLDAILNQSFTRDLDVDAILKANFTKEAFLDALIHEVGRTIGTALDAILYVSGITTDLDAILKAVFAKETSLDALLKETGIEKETFLDALLKAVDQLKTTEIDAILKAEYLRTLSLDALISTDGTLKTTALDAYLKNVFDKETFLDALLAGQVLSTTDLDALLTVADVLITTNLDAILKQAFTKVLSLDSLLTKTLTAFTELDALLTKSLTKSTNIDSLLTKSTLKITDLDAILAQGQTKDTALDAWLLKTGKPTTDLDSLILKAQEKTSEIDAILLAGYTKTLEVDALLTANLTETTDLDALLKYYLEKTTNLDAILESGLTARAYGEENPTQGEFMISWATWLMSDGGAVTVIGDSDWGKLQLLTGELAQGPVFQMGAGTWPINVIKNRYGSGQGSFKVWIRGATTNFAQLAGSPSWEEWTGVVDRTWTYGQVRLEGL